MACFSAPQEQVQGHYLPDSEDPSRVEQWELPAPSFHQSAFQLGLIAG